MSISSKTRDRFTGKECLTLFGCSLIFLVLLLLCGVLAVALQFRHLLIPYRVPYLGPLNRPHQDVSFTTVDGVDISGWYIAGTRPEAIILVHGVHANRGYLIPQAEILAGAGYHVLLIDLRGHGTSGGRLMTYGYREAWDVQAGVDYLLALPEVDRVGALGHSLGGAAVVRAAANDERIRAIVVQSSYSSLSLAIDESFQNFSVFPKEPFASLFITLAEIIVGAQVSNVDSARDLATMTPRPVLIIHSVDDNLFPPHHAKTMFQAAQEPKKLWIVTGLGHVNPMVDHEAAYRDEILGFFEEAFDSVSRRK
jgi:dipeptidyl aminopeptidase/acylaminoacyl peptidase